nr:hypothetical protein [Williamsia soli]
MAETEMDQKQLAEQLLAQAKKQGAELMGPYGFLDLLTKNVRETLDAEVNSGVQFRVRRREFRRAIVI